MIRFRPPSKGIDADGRPCATRRIARVRAQAMFLLVALAAVVAYRPALAAEAAAEPAEWKALAAELRLAPDAVADFEERRYFPFRQEPVVLNGEVRVSRIHGLSLRYTSPEARLVIVDDRGVLVREKSGEKTPPADPRARAANEAMLHILRLDFPALEKSFAVSVVRGPDEWRLVLVPRADNLKKALGEVHVAGDSRSVRQIELRRSAKQRIEIVLSAPRSEQPFTPDELQRFFR